MKNIDPLRGDQLPTNACYDAVDFGQANNRYQAREEPGKRKYSGSRPLRLGRVSNGVCFRLKLPDDANR